MTDIIHQDSELEGVDEGDLEGLAGTDIPVFPSSDRSLADLERLYKEGTLKLDADWQRGYVWTSKRASRLIESFLIGLPIPVIYLAENDDYEYEVIDGMQRLTSVFSFLNNDLKLTGLEIMADLNGCHFKDLQKPLQNKLRNSSLRTIVCPQTSDKNLKYLMFERLNTGGIALNEMEIRNCLYRGKLNDLIKELAQFKEFKECMAQKNIHRRMKDRTLVLRFLAFYQMTYSKAKKGLKAFFNEFFETYRDPGQEKLNEFSSKFKGAMKAAFTIFGDRGFKLNPTSRSVNASIFQVICVSFSDYDQGALTRSADAIYKAYLDLIETDLHWVNCVSTSTSTYNRISYTFETWNERLKQVMETAEPNDSKRLFPRELKEGLYSQSKVCEICGQQIAHIDDAALDHDKQHWQGGKTVPENARLVHRHCNATRPRSEAPAGRRIDRTDDWAFKDIRAFTFRGRICEVRKWTDFLEKFCEILSKDYPDRFQDAVELYPKMLSKSQDGFRREEAYARRIGRTDIYVLTHMGNNDKKKEIERLVTHFGCDMPVIYTD